MPPPAVPAAERSQEMLVWWDLVRAPRRFPYTSTISCANRNVQTAGLELASNCASRTSAPVDQGRVVVWRVDIQRNKRITHSDVFNVILIAMLELAGAGSRERLQKNLNQFAAHKIRMPVLALQLRHHRPHILRSRLKSFSQ